MSENVENRQLVVPGKILAKGMEFLPGDGAYRDQDEIRASVLGLVNFKGRAIKVIPLNGKYLPKRDDPVIGIITEVGYNSWNLDINATYTARMLVGDASDRYIDTNRHKLASVFGVGDAVICQIKKVDENMAVFVTARGPGLRKVHDGKLVYVNAAKIPRIIGKGASMVKMIKEYTETRMFVGQNGIVWIQGGNEELAEKAVLKIEAEAHLVGLTDKMEQFLSKESGKTINRDEPKPEPEAVAEGTEEKKEEGE
ncbi:MAG: RNA-binding protein [Candidatus Altiarchaeota archaeon]|nr:RNA-binding protein [Candidatus Altiarchaeota archaeon]